MWLRRSCDAPFSRFQRINPVNYVAALDWLDERHRNGTIQYRPEFLKELHVVLTHGLGRPDDRFKPHHESEWRDGEVRVVARRQKEVARLMLDRLEWLEDRRSNPEYFGPIIAGLAHFEVAEVHPFADYNGRTARLFAVAAVLLPLIPSAKRSSRLARGSRASSP